MSLVVISTHPIQYHAPLYRAVQERFQVPVTAIYGSDFSVAGYSDREFGVRFAWDTDLLSGYRSLFLGRVGEGGPSSAEAVTAAGLRAALRATQPAVVLMIGYATTLYRSALRQIWYGGYPIIFRAETTDHARPRGLLKQLARDIALRALYGRCAALLYVGARSQAHYLRLGCPAERLIFSPYCVDTTPFATDEAARERLRPEARAALGIDDERIAVVFSGKLVQRKRPDVLVQAIKALPPELRARLTLLFLGDGELRDELHALAAAPPSVDLRILGLQGQRALSPYYHAADLLALPSQTDETWGLVVNEALHHGLPCVVSDQVGCAPDLIEPSVTGEVFPAGAAGAMAAALERAVALRGRPEVRAACRARVDGYTVERAAEGIAMAYRRALTTAAPVGAP